MNLKHVLILIQKDLLLELRNKYILGSILLFVITSTFIIYKSFQSVSLMAWNVLFWIIFTFSALNALIRSFNQEYSRSYLYYYQIADPGEIIFSKLIYNTLMLLLVSIILFFSMSIFISNPVENRGLFIIAVFLACIGFSTCFTFVSSILGNSSKQMSLMPVLSLPLIIPILLLLIKISANALQIVNDSSVTQDLILLGGIDLILFGIALIIYPILWRS